MNRKPRRKTNIVLTTVKGTLFALKDKKQKVILSPLFERLPDFEKWAKENKWRCFADTIDGPAYEKLRV